MSKARVGIVVGSENDLVVIEEARKVLKELGVESEINVLSAHRTPDLAKEYADSAEKRGLSVIIAGAGMANHLAGAMAAHSLLPIIGVPLDASPLQGMDALLSTVQMPPGIPVACVAIGKAGAKNAGFLAAHIIALQDSAVAQKLRQKREDNKKAVIAKNKELAS